MSTELRHVSWSTRLVPLLAVLAVGVSAAPVPPQATPVYTPLHTLKPAEGVFAYARISPDGRRLIYASQLPARPGAPRIWTETLVDLTTNTVLFNESGIDAYWSLDGTRDHLLGRRRRDRAERRHRRQGHQSGRERARRLLQLGDARRQGSDPHDREQLLLPRSATRPCCRSTKVSSVPGIGTGERPLISKDGRRITTFVKGNVVVRGLDNCDDIFDTGIQGAKADFSWDGRYIAFHALKSNGRRVRDQDRRHREAHRAHAPGSERLGAVSELDAGRAAVLPLRRSGLSRLHDGERRARRRRRCRCPPAPQALPAERTWSEIFPETPRAAGPVSASS